MNIPGCKETKTEYSATLYENAFVSDAVYTPSKHETEIGVTAFDGGLMGVDYGGNAGIQIGGGMQISSVTVPEKFAVVFKCAHGKFIVQKASVYDQLKSAIGKTVKVAYREVYRVTYDDVDGTTKVIARELADYDFLSATVIDTAR
jgi:hypothetical protein